MSECIHVLHVIRAMDRGGAETMIMNLYRHIDRSRIKFDFLVHVENKCDYDDEILKLGGRIFHIIPYIIMSLIRVSLRSYWKRIQKFRLYMDILEVVHLYI